MKEMEKVGGNTGSSLFGCVIHSKKYPQFDKEWERYRIGEGGRDCRHDLPPRPTMSFRFEGGRSGGTGGGPDQGSARRTSRCTC
jgi:hypothetical protein